MRKALALASLLALGACAGGTTYSTTLTKCYHEGGQEMCRVEQAGQAYTSPLAQEAPPSIAAPPYGPSPTQQALTNVGWGLLLAQRPYSYPRITTCQPWGLGAQCTSY